MQFDRRQVISRIVIAVKQSVVVVILSRVNNFSDFLSEKGQGAAKISKDNRSRYRALVTRKKIRNQIRDIKTLLIISDKVI